MELTQNEKKLLVALGESGSADATSLAEKMNTRPEAVVQYANLARERGLVELRNTSPCATGRRRRAGLCREGSSRAAVVREFRESYPYA